MKTAKTSKRALLCSVLSIALCLSMLIGTTFAWFTDTASTGVSKITSGSLHVAIQDKDGNPVETLSWVAKDGRAQDQIYWEPGCTYTLTPFKIVNTGTLALKYKMVITGLDGDSELLKVIKFSYTMDGTTLDLDKEGHLTAAGTSTAETKMITVSATMDTTAGNDYQGKTLDGVSIKVYATQDTVEYDSINNTYDKDAVYPIVAMDTLQELINNAAEPVSAKLEGNIAGSLTVPQDKNITLDLNGFTLTGGDSHAILNRGTLCIKDSSGNGKIVASKANTSALRNAAVCVIEGGTFTRAAGENNKWHTVENFGTMTFNGGKVIAEDGQSFAIVNGWNYMNPGEQKATMTINNIEMKAAPNGFKNCAGGILTMNDGTLHCTGYWGLSNDSTGIATINGGKITSDGYIAISDGGAKMEINGGTFTGPRGSLYVQAYAQGTVVKGGSYQNETVDFMQKYCPAGYTAKPEDGMVVVSKD